MYSNFHVSGTTTNMGCENFTFWGSNTYSGTFDDLVYANDDGWTQISTYRSIERKKGSDGRIHFA